MKRPEPLSAFYWREQMVPLSPVGDRRTSKQVDALRARALELRKDGWSLDEIAERLNTPKRYVKDLLYQDRKPS